jgi:hypothetical protein
MSAGKQAAPPWNHRSTWFVVAFAVLLAALVLGNRTLFAQGGGAITVTAPDPSQDPAAGPSPMPVLTAATGGVSAAVSNPPTQPGYGQTITATWMWSITSIQYAPLQSAAWGNPPVGAGCVVALGTSTDTYSNSVNTVTGAFGAAGYWQVTVTATVTYTGPGDPQSGSASMAVVFPVFSLSITPASVYVPVGGTAPATGIVVPADLVGYFTCMTTNGNVATVTAGTPTGGNVPLMVTGMQAGTTQLQGSLGSGPPATANVTVGTFSLTPQSPAICAGGIATPIHQTLLTAVLTDSSGNPQAGQQITFSTDNGTVNPTSAVTDSNGTATTTLLSNSEASDPRANPPTKYLATVTALGPSQSAQAQVEFQPPWITLTAQPNSILLTETSNLVAQLTWNQQPVSGHTIAYTITGIWDQYGNQVYNGQGTPPASYGSIQGPSQQTDSTGTATAQFVPGTNYGTVEITAADTSVFFADNSLNPLAKFKLGLAFVAPWALYLNYNGQTAPTVTLTNAFPAGGKPPETIKAPEWRRQWGAEPPNPAAAAFVRGNAFNMQVTFWANTNVPLTFQGDIVADRMASGKASTLKDTVTSQAVVTFPRQYKSWYFGTNTFTTSIALANWVDIHSIVVQWQYQDPVSGLWTNAGTPTKFMVYAVDQTPKPTTDGNNYLQLVHKGCAAAAGQSSAAGGDPVFQAIWTYVQTLKMGNDAPAAGYLKYWGTYASAGNYPLGQNTTVGLIVHGDGRCEAWALYFADLCRVQGIAVNNFDIQPPDGYVGFAFNNLTVPEGSKGPSKNDFQDWSELPQADTPGWDRPSEVIFRRPLSSLLLRPRTTWPFTRRLPSCGSRVLPRKGNPLLRVLPPDPGNRTASTVGSARRSLITLSPIATRITTGSGMREN